VNLVPSAREPEKRTFPAVSIFTEATPEPDFLAGVLRRGIGANAGARVGANGTTLSFRGERKNGCATAAGTIA
jgi:hypothetical protein